EYLHSGIPGLQNRFRHNFLRYAWKLQVQLKAGNTVSGAAKLEVHVAEMIFRPDNICKGGIALQLLSLIFRNQSDRNTGHWFSDWNAGVHERHHTGTNTCHRSRAI